MQTWHESNLVSVKLFKGIDSWRLKHNCAANRFPRCWVEAEKQGLKHALALDMAAHYWGSKIA